MALLDPPNASDKPERETAARPAVRVVSTLDRLGLRYLSADVALLWAAGCWPLPLAVAERDDTGEPESWIESEPLDRALARAARSDTHLERRTVKAGQLLVEEAVDRLAEYLQDAPARVVVDPELNDRDGRPRSNPRVAEVVGRKLVPGAQLVVANAAEAAALTGRRVDGPATMREAARALFDRGAKAVLVTGAHLEGAPIDWLYDGRGYEEIGADRVAIEGRIRGAGGILSALLTAGLAHGKSVLAAAHRARAGVTAALRERHWVTAAGLLPTAAFDAKDRPPGYWIANVAAAHEHRR